MLSVSLYFYLLIRSLQSAVCGHFLRPAESWRSQFPGPRLSWNWPPCECTRDQRVGFPFPLLHSRLPFSEVHLASAWGLTSVCCCQVQRTREHQTPYEIWFLGLLFYTWDIFLNFFKYMKAFLVIFLKLLLISSLVSSWSRNILDDFSPGRPDEMCRQSFPWPRLGNTSRVCLPKHVGSAGWVCVLLRSLGQVCWLGSNLCVFPDNFIYFGQLLREMC